MIVNGSGKPCKIPGAFWRWQKTFVIWPRKSIHNKWLWWEWAFLKPSSAPDGEAFIGWAYLSEKDGLFEILKGE
jgi:hypothetical protein